MKKNQLLKITSLALLTLSLSACLKDDLYTADTDEGTNTVEFLEPAQAGDADHLYPVTEEYFSVSPSAESEITISYSGGKPAPEDIVVKVAIDQAALERYNARIIEVARQTAIDQDQDPDDAEEEAQADLYDLMPTNLYSLSAMEVTIKKGESKAAIKFTTKPNQYDFNYRYVVPLTITSVSSTKVQLSGTFATAFYYYGAKNQWDGKYSYSTSANTSLRPSSKASVTLLTAGANRLRLSPGLLGYYSNEVYYNIDPSNNSITVECPSLGVQTPQDTRSKYDPATKTFKVYWKQGNGGRTFEETLVYTGPR
ncbi:DUF1735 domain-containing protein [Arcticibacter tournemirensis]